MHQQTQYPEEARKDNDDFLDSVIQEWMLEEGLDLAEPAKVYLMDHSPMFDDEVDNLVIGWLTGCKAVTTDRNVGRAMHVEKKEFEVFLQNYIYDEYHDNSEEWISKYLSQKEKVA